MMLFVRQELSFDKGQHRQEDRIYRLGGSTIGWPDGKLLEAEYPEVERVTYMRSYQPNCLSDSLVKPIRPAGS